MGNKTLDFVIIGGSFAGVKAVESILRLGSNVRVTMISSSTHAFYCVASPRAIVQTELTDKLFFPVETKLKALGGSKIEFVLGEVTKLDFGKNIILYRVGGSPLETSISYDYLVIASGSSSHHNAFKLNGSYEKTKSAILDLSDEIRNAKSIAILGGGATGVEIAGELGHLYGKTKNITIYSGNGDLLKDTTSSVSTSATEQLLRLNVISKKLSSKIVEKQGGRYKITFNSGESTIVDLVIKAYGCIANSQFIEKQFLDDHGFVMTDDQLRVKSHPNVICLGDIVSGRPKTVVDLQMCQLPVFVATLRHSILGEQANTKKLGDSKKIILIPISRSGGVGLISGFKVPSCIVRFLKSKDFMISEGPKNFE